MVILGIQIASTVIWFIFIPKKFHVTQICSCKIIFASLVDCSSKINFMLSLVDEI